MSVEGIMRTIGFALVAAGVMALVADAPARAADHRGATAQQSGQQAGRQGNAVLRFAVWVAVEDALDTGGTSQDLVNAVTEAISWWQSTEPSVTSEQWLFVDVARVAAHNVIKANGSESDLFNALDQVVTWWKGIEGSLPTTEDRLFRFVVGLTLEGVAEKGGTLQDAITAVNQVIAALDEMSGTSGTTGTNGSTGTTGTTGSTGTKGSTGTTSGGTTGGTTGTTTGTGQSSTGGTAGAVTSTAVGSVGPPR
jgi:hypothetical protein